MTLFSLLAVFAATMAWFAMNENVGGSGMNIQITRMDGKLKYVYFHSFAGMADDDTSFTFNKTEFAKYEYDWENEQIDIITNPSAISWNMGEYSPFDKNHPLLILFEFDKDYVSAAQGDSYIKGTTTVEDFLGKRESNGAPHYTLPQTTVNSESNPGSLLMSKATNEDEFDYYALSSVVGFRHRTFSNSQYTTFLTGNAGDTLKFATNSFNKGQAFTTVDNATETYEYVQTPLVYKSDGVSTVKYVALIVEYSSDAIGYIYSTYLGDSGLNSYNSTLHFSCDWYFEVF